MKYELELVRKYYRADEGNDIERTIKLSDNEGELIELSRTIKLKKGKTFYEQLNLLTFNTDENSDIIENERLRDSEDVSHIRVGLDRTLEVLE